MKLKQILVILIILVGSAFSIGANLKNWTLPTRQISQDNINAISPKINGDFVVWTGYSDAWLGKRIYLYQISTNTTSQLTDTNTEKYGQQIDGDFIVWNGRIPNNFLYEIFLYQISTGVTTQITNNTAQDRNVAVDGDFVVWSSNADGDFEIYVYQISTGITTQVSHNTTRPAIFQIDGDFITWREIEKKDYQIFLYEISTGITTQLYGNNKPKTSASLPAIDGDFITWSSNIDGDNEIYLYQISAGTTKQITFNTYHDSSPFINGDTIIWDSALTGRYTTFLYRISTKTTAEIPEAPGSGSLLLLNGDYFFWHLPLKSLITLYYQIGTGDHGFLPHSNISSKWPDKDGDFITWTGEYIDGYNYVYLAGPFPTETLIATPSSRPRTETLPDTGFAPNTITELNAQPANLTYASTDLVLNIPSLGVSQTIVGVPQSADGWNVNWLGNSIGYLAGTAFPTWAGNTALTGHVWNADGSAGIFANLNQLQSGDRFTIEAWGLTYTYEVRDSEQVYETNLGVLSHSDYDIVTLLTCEDFSEYSGEYRYRRAVTAVLVSVK